MAVEIPVVINIDKAFQDAAKRVGVAIEPLRKSIENLTEDLATWTSLMREADINSDDWLISAKNIQVISEKLAEADYQLRRYTSNTGSIKRMSIDLAELNRRWEAMGASEKFGPDGKTLSADAQKAVAQYKQITAELNRQGKTLQEIVAEENRLQQLHQKGIQSRRYENAILNTTAKTMRVLQEQERILADRLSRTRLGSNAYKELKTELEGVRRELSEINGDATQTENKLGRLLKNTLRLVALHTAGTFLRNVREVTAEFELQRVALGSIIQDTERASSLFRQIKAAAIESPFEIKDLVSYTKQLSAYQIETDKLFETTMKLADVSAGLGVDMSRLVLAYGQVRAAAVLRGQELRQFTEAGIPLVDKLAEKFRELGREGTTTADVFQLISERAVPFRMIEEIFDDMTSAGGMFYKMQEKQAKTLAGQWANLKDAVSIMYDEIGNTKVVHGAMETLIGDARWLMQHWRDLANMISIVGTAIISYTGYLKASELWTKLVAKAEELAIAAESKRERGIKRLIISITGKTTASKIATIATNLHTAAMNRASAAGTKLTATLWRLAAALANNPFSIAVIAIGALIAAITTLGKKTRDVNQSVNEAEASIVSFNKVTGETKRLIEQYDELANKEKLTADEAKKLRDVSRELSTIFPKTTEGIDSQTGALTLNIEKLKEYNTEAEKAIRKGMEAQIRENEKAIKDNQKQIEKLTRDNARGWGRNKKLGLFSPILFPLSDAQLSENSAALVKLQNDNEARINSNIELRNTLDGVAKSAEEVSAKTTKWQDKLIEFNSRLSADGTSLQVVSPDQIKNYSKLSDALEDIAKKYKEYSEQEKTLKASIENKTGAEKDELQGILDRTSARKALAKEELDYYNAFYLTQKGSGNRSDRLRELRNDISDITNAYKKFVELRKYEHKTLALSDIGTLFPSLAGWEPTYENMVKRFEEMLNQYKGDADATRIIEQALANIKFDKIKEDFSDALKKLSDDIKRSETARNFYNNILGLTGDEKMAATLTMDVYGQTGDEFKERVQKEMFGALESVKGLIGEDFFNELTGDITIFDLKHIREQFEKLPKVIQPLFDRLLAENEKYNEDWLIDFQKTYGKAMDYQQRIETLNNQRREKINQAEEKNKSVSDIAAINAYYDKEVAKVEVERLKNTDEWIQSFENLDKVGTSTLKDLIRMIKELLEKSGADMEPEALRILMRNLEEVEEQVYKRNPFEEMSKGLRSYIDTIGGIRRARKALKQEEDEEIRGKLKDSETQQRTSIEQMKTSVKGLSDTFNNLQSIVSSVSDLLALDELSDGEAILSGVSQGIQMVGTALALVSAILTAMAANPVVLGITAAIAAVASLGKVINNLRVAKQNREIERQQDILDRLTYSYSRLEAAQAKAFGSDYIRNYNDQLEILEGQQAAYLAQAEAERNKGKKKDKDKIKDYEDAAQDTADKITEMRGQLAEFFTGSDLTSAAKDFANAWIEAYKEFGSTTTAMSEKFNEMIQEMIQNSIAAKVMENLLSPIFKEIDNLAQSEGELTAQEVAQIAADARNTIPAINDAMTNLMNQLRAAGYNVRDTAGSFTGISRNIASASEESINGLTQAVNTQNFYFSYVPTISQNVAAILAVISGGSVSTQTAEFTAEGVALPSVQRMVHDHLPNIDANIADMRNMLKSIITPKTAATNTHCVAIK